MKLSKNDIKKRLISKVSSRLNELKKLAARDIFAEAKFDDEQISDIDDKDLVNEPSKIFRVKTSPKSYRYQFPFKSRMYVVDFNSIDNSPIKFSASFHAKGFDDSENPSSRFGISSYAMIEPVFVNVLRVVEQFLESRRPTLLRFVPGHGIAFPAIFHQYIYPSLKDFQHRLKNKYSIVRGDVIKDGSAFVLRKGGAQSQLKTKSWRPSAEKQKQEQIANVTGPAVATDVPFKSKEKQAEKKYRIK